MGNVNMEADQIHVRDNSHKTWRTVADALKALEASGEGVAEDITELYTRDASRASKDDIANEFSAEQAYYTGDFVYYQGSLFKFIANHAAGAWNPEDVAPEQIGQDIVTLKSGLTNYENQNNLNLEVPDRKNLFNKDDAGNLTGRALNSETGEPYVTSGWMTSSFIKIEPSTNYTLTTTSSNSSVAFYDSEQVYISGASSFGTKETPSNAKYLRFDYKAEDAANMQLEYGSTATSYTPYIPSVESRLAALEAAIEQLTNG